MPRPTVLIQANIIVKIAQCDAEDKAAKVMSSAANILANDAANEPDQKKAADLQAEAAAATAQAAQHTANAQKLFDETEVLHQELAATVEAEEIGEITATGAPSNGPTQLFKNAIALEMAGLRHKKPPPTLVE